MDDLMRAVIRTFHDINLRVELVPEQSSDPMPADTGTGTTRARDDSMQAVDGQYATVYRVNHCKLTPTSPPPWTTEFPPQRAELLPGRDNFQVGGTGSGETGPLPNKSSCYRGGLNWTSREAVYFPRVSHTTDTFASSLRKYPPSFEYLPSIEHCSVVERLDKPPRTRNRRSSRSRPSSPTRRYQIPDIPKYEKESDDTLEYPTRDWSDASSRMSVSSFEELFWKISPRLKRQHVFRKPVRPLEMLELTIRGKTYTKQEHLNYILNISKTHWNKPKSISAYTHTRTTAACTDGYDVTTNDWYTARQESTEVDHRLGLATGMRKLQVNTPVQAVAQKISQEMETVPLPVPSRRSIAVSPSMASLPTLSIHVSPITRSVQTFQLSGIPVETTTSSIEIAKHDYAIAKKSKSFSEFKLEHDFKSQVLEWLDDTSDPKIREFQEMVLRNLTRRLKKIRVPDTERIKVKMADCVKSRLKMRSISKLSDEINDKRETCENKCNIFRAAINSSLTTDHSYIEDVIKEWLSNICIKKRDIFNKPVKKDQILNTIVNRLKNLVVKQSKHCREQLLREEIMDMLEEVPIEVNSRDKTNYLELVANDLMYRLEKVSRDTEIKSFKFDKSEKLNIYEPKSNLLPTDKQKNECGVKEIADAFKNRSMLNSELIKEIMIDFEDILMSSVCPNGRVEEILNLLHNTVKLPESESIQCAIKLTDDRRHILNRKFTNHAAVLQFSVFMLQLLSKNNIFKLSESEMSQNSIVSNVDNDVEANLNQYKIQLGKQIERWLSNLTILQTYEKDFRQAAVLDLVNDIVDRQKYLEIKKNRESDMDALEHLKYMIFKWSKRIIGEENMDTVGHAAELMEMLRSIPVPIFTKSHDQLCAGNSVLRVSGNDHSALSTNMSMSNNVSITKTNSRIRKPYSRNRYKGNRNRSVCTNFLVHKVSTRIGNGSKKAMKRSGQVPPSSNQGKTINTQSDISNKSDSSKPVQKNRKNSQGPKLKKCDNKVCNPYSGATCTGAENVIHNNDVRSGNDVEHSLLNLAEHPGPSGLVTPTTVSTEKGSSATSKLMADWRPPPKYTPPPPGKPRLEIVHDEFQEYLQNWSKQIPIPATNSEEEKTAEQARLGILKGIWKMITKLKTQPAVYQNKFYYEDVLGKEIDELLNCLPQTQELREKRYMLKAQLLEKTTAMNELVQDLEMPDNYKEILDRNLLEKQNERIRKVVNLNNENPTKMFEQMFKYCVLDDFLLKSNYKEHDKIKDKAYKIKLMEKIQAYVDELKTTYGKELEDLFNVVHESDIMRILYNVPLPSDESVKENADEIFLGLEIEQWMMDLPIVNNNDSSEQRHRRRLRDALTKKLLAMEKYANVPSCCEETQVRHEISIFLDKVPLEQDQDLNINDMVDDLTKRLKNRHVASDRRKSVAFQNRQQNQQRMNETGRLLHQSQFTNKWNLEEDGEARYSDFYKNGPLCSTRIEPPGDEWAMEEGQDAQYKALFKDRPACSSMIEPQAAYGIDEAPRLPGFQHSNEQEPIFTYIPGQFHESARGGSFRYPPRGSIPYNHERYQYPEPSMMSQYGPSAPRFYDSQGNSIRDYPLPSHVDNQYRSIPGVDARQSIPPMMQPAMNYIRSRGDFEGQNDASGGFVSMMEHGPQSSMRIRSDRFSNARRQSFNLHRSGMNANMPQDVAPAGFFTSTRNGRSLIEPHPQAPFYPDASVFSSGPSNQSRWNGVEVDSNMQPQMMQPFNQPRDFEDRNEASGGFVSMIEHGYQSPMRSRSEQSRANRGSNQYRRNSVEIDPNVQQEPLEASVHEASRFSREQLNDPSSYRGVDADLLQPDPGEGEFSSMRSHQSRGAAQSPSAPLQTSTRNQSIRQSNRSSKHQLEPIVETASEQLPEAPRSESDGINQSRNANRPAHNTQVSHRSMPNVPIRESVPTTHEAVSRSPAVSPQRNARGLRASNVPSEISNHPVGFSTPNQRPDNDAPPNIRRQRQMDKERASVRRLFSDNEDSEGRCHCVERFKRWHRQNSSNCNTCDDCVHGGSRPFFSYPYPFPYPYPYPPPYPPYCKR